MNDTPDDSWYEPSKIFQDTFNVENVDQNTKNLVYKMAIRIKHLHAELIILKKRLETLENK